MGVVDALAHRGRFFRVLQQTSRSQTAVMTIAPGEDAGPEEEHAGDQVIYVVEGEAIDIGADGELVVTSGDGTRGGTPKIPRTPTSAAPSCRARCRRGACRN